MSSFNGLWVSPQAHFLYCLYFFINICYTNTNIVIYSSLSLFEVRVVKEKTCCFTGHRDIPSGAYQHIFSKTEEMVENLIKKGYLFFGAGGALGFDTIAALTVLKLKEKYPDVRLILVLPCLSQTRGWSSHDVEIYEDIKSRADKVVYTSEEYTRGCMHKRNRHLVDNSSACIAYLTDSKGGTAYTVDYAKKHGLIVYNIADYI